REYLDAHINYQPSKSCVWQRRGKHGVDTAGDPDLDGDGTFNHQLSSVDWYGLHDIGSHPPGYPESDSIGDSQCAVRSSRCGRGNRPGDHPEQFLDQWYRDDRPDGDGDRDGSAGAGHLACATIES